MITAVSVGAVGSHQGIVYLTRSQRWAIGNSTESDESLSNFLHLTEESKNSLCYNYVYSTVQSSLIRVFLKRMPKAKQSSTVWLRQKFSSRSEIFNFFHVENTAEGYRCIRFVISCEYT